MCIRDRNGTKNLQLHCPDKTCVVVEKTEPRAKMAANHRITEK
jgi:hypothetical protein